MSLSPPVDGRQQPQPSSTSKSLTPQRKHRKLLKDGSGTAVWPEAIEALFVQGLRAYWDSPWATYSRGRSRWRNQFLVDYLQSLGITRTKKQVASHIQVLRNMWKGEPEYQLVAGGEELFQDPVKVEDTHLLTIDHDDEDDASSLSNSPPEYLTEFPPSPAETSPMFPGPGLSYSPSSPISSILPEIESPPNTVTNLAAPYPYAVNQKPYPADYPAAYSQPNVTSIAPVGYLNRITCLTLLAEGMTPFMVSIDKLLPPSPSPTHAPPLALRLRLSIPPVNDPRAPVAFQGFFASVRLAAVWSAHAKIITRVYDPASRCVATEVAALLASNIDLGTVVADLPESSLTRARWFDPNTQATITQHLVVDDATLLVVTYELDQRTGQALPSVEFVSFQKYASSAEVRASAGNGFVAPAYAQAQPPSMYPSPPVAPASLQTYSPNGYYVSQHMYAQHGHQHSPSSTSSLSAALTPVS